jgi:hypothetical protein
MRRWRIKRFFFCLVLIATGAALPAQQLTVPRQPGSIRFAVIGDMGTGRMPQYELAARMETLRHTFPFDFVITLGDNIYGGSGANDFLTKFELPYKVLLDAGVKFYASLGNHDGTEESLYKPFNMGGQRYYTHKKGKTQFFALDSNYLFCRGCGRAVEEGQSEERNKPDGHRIRRGPLIHPDRHLRQHIELSNVVSHRPGRRFRPRRAGWTDRLTRSASR